MPKSMPKLVEFLLHLEYQYQNIKRKNHDSLNLNAKAPVDPPNIPAASLGLFCRQI